MPKEIILDTDIGTDVDDCLALATALGSPELNLLGVTCVYGDVVLRSRMIQQLLHMAGRDDVAVYAGAGMTLTGRRSVYWEGHEGEGILDETTRLPPLPEKHAATYLVETVRKRPGQVHLIGIGPLTNIALALSLEPKLLELVASFTIMGGAARTSGDFDLPVAEHNLACDPEAAHIVFAHSVRTEVIPLDVTTLVTIRPDTLDELLAAPHPFTWAIGDQLRRYPRFHEQGFTYPHDPLAVLSVARPDLFSRTDLHVDILSDRSEYDGAMLISAPSKTRPANSSVSLRVNSDVIERELRQRLLQEAVMGKRVSLGNSRH